MPWAVAPRLAVKADNIVLAMHHGNQVNKSVWHDSSLLCRKQQPQYGYSCLPPSGTPLSNTEMLSGGATCLGGLHEEPRLLSHLID